MSASLNAPAIHKPSRVEPPDYERQLLDRREELRSEQFPNLLLFPQQDVTVKTEPREYRTQKCSVSEESLQKQTSLFTKECLKFYSSEWERVIYNYSKYSSNYTALVDEEEQELLPPFTFERDLLEAERMEQKEADSAQKPLSKSGYLHKGPFPGDGGFSVSMRTYKRRWFDLRGGPTYGGYVLIHYKDERSTAMKGRINLETCTDIRRNNKLKTYGFDLVTADEKVYYSLAADNEKDLEDWMCTLGKAIGLDTEDQATPVKPVYSRDTLKESQKKSLLRPDLLQHSATTEKVSAQNREQERNSLFILYPPLTGAGDDNRPTSPTPPQEHFGTQISILCEDLKLKLTVNRLGRDMHVEPFFVTLSVFDALQGTKISEDFHVDLNDPEVIELLPDTHEELDQGDVDLDDEDELQTKLANTARVSFFSVTFPHPDVFLVVRVEKVLQGTISSCTEPYIKLSDSKKAAEKISKQMPVVCERLGRYRMPFAWTARPLFRSAEELDLTSEFLPLYRQDKDRLTDSDLLKILADFKNLGKMKLQVIPGSFHASIKPYNGHGGMTLSSSLLPLKKKAYVDETDSTLQLLAREVEEFPPQTDYDCYTHCTPHLSLIHNLYVYPRFLKYDSQKSFTKARTISVRVQLKDGDSRDAAPLPIIFSTSLNEVFTDTANTSVTYHCTTPTFYDEIKMKLPLRLHKRHHLLFTFIHLSCDITKASKNRGSLKASSIESIVGYSWLPLLSANGSLASGLEQLPVATTLPPGYLSSMRGDLAKAEVPVPDVKWVDNQRLLFSVTVKLDSTIYPQDGDLYTFFAVCDHVHRDCDVVAADFETVIESLAEVDPGTLQSLPVIFNQLFSLLCSPKEVVSRLKKDIFRTMVKLVDRLVSMEKSAILRSYVEFVFATELDEENNEAVHDVLSSLLVEFLNENLQEESRKILGYVWFFLDVILKSMAQYLTLIGRETASRKTRFLEGFGWNIQNLVTSLVRLAINYCASPDGKSANTSLARFVKSCFSFMDRGVVFGLIASYLEMVDQHSGEDVVDMRLEFLKIVCEHEHFVCLNLPFQITPEKVFYTLTAKFCEQHYLVGILLREVEAALKGGPLSARKKVIAILRDLLAKHESDDRFALPAQKARIAMLYFPLVSMVLENFDKLHKFEEEVEATDSPVVDPYSMDPLTSLSASSTADDMQARKSPGLGRKSPANESYRESPKKKTSISLSEAAKHISGMRFRKSPSCSDLMPIEDVASLQFYPTSVTPPKLGMDDSGSITGSTSGADQAEGREGVEEVDGKKVDEEGEDVSLLLEQEESLTLEETKDLFISFLFVIKYVEDGVLKFWWKECLKDNADSMKFSWIDVSSDLMIINFFKVLEMSIHLFKYPGRAAISQKGTMRSNMLRELEMTYLEETRMQKTGGARKSLAMSRALSGPGSRLTHFSSFASSTSLAQKEMKQLEADGLVRMEAALSNEVGLTVLETLVFFSEYFKHDLLEDDGDNELMEKFFAVLISLLHVNQSTSLQSHIFSSVRAFVHKFPSVLYKGSPEYCAALSYEALRHCNSRIFAVRTEASALLYLLVRCNFRFFKKKSCFRSSLQTTIALSKIVTRGVPESYVYLRRCLGIIATYAENDEEFLQSTFPAEVKDLTNRLRTVLSSTAQMKEHRIDPEKLMDLHYMLAKSYSHSPQLRHTWLETMTKLHVSYGNFSEAAQCSLHVAGIMAEHLKLQGTYKDGCKELCCVSPNVEREESGLMMDQEGKDEVPYSEADYVDVLEKAIGYLDQSERYELMTGVFKLLLPFYEEQRDFKKLTEMYGRLYEAHKRVLCIMQTGRRYLATYFRVGFYGQQYFGDDHAKQFVYKEPKITNLTEITQRLLKLYSRKFGPDTVCILKESGKVKLEQLDPDLAYIQITHVVPYFDEKELSERPTKFEREDRISKFIFETPFNTAGKSHGPIANQWMRKTILTTSHWFPYITKRIPIIEERQFEISPIQVAIEAIDKKRADLVEELHRETPDLVKIQLILQGSISAQVNQGVQEYANVFLKNAPDKFTQPHINKLKAAYSSFLHSCEELLELHGRLISKKQVLLQDELTFKFSMMTQQLGPLLEKFHPTLLATMSDPSLVKKSATPSPSDLKPKAYRRSSGLGTA